MKLLTARTSTREARALGADARDAANDDASEPGDLTPAAVDEEIRRMEARALEQRRIDREQQYARDNSTSPEHWTHRWPA